MPQTVLHPLAPLITAESHTLILGTMPSPRSRAETFYYAHPQNRFWPVIAALYGEVDPKTSEGRAELLLSHGLALWDVLASCTITGAADSTIRDPLPHDIPGFTAAWWSPKLVCPPSGCPAPPLPMPAPHSRSWWPPIAPPCCNITTGAERLLPLPPT